jgi:preprotein translocase subunit SecE
VAESNRRGDEDAAGDEHVDDVFDDAIDDDVSADEEAAASGSGGTATKALPKGKKTERPEGAGSFGRLGRFVREIIAELRKVIWPTRKELLTYTAVVVAFVTVMLAIVAGLDYGFAKGVLFVFGHGN